VIEVRGQHHARAGTLIARRETTGAPAKLLLHTDKPALTADGEDTVVISCEVQDAEGRLVPTAMNNVQFNVTGPGRIIGVGNGDPSSHEPDRATKRNAFNGLCMALVQSSKTGGSVTITASSPGLTSAALTLASAGQPRAALP
jgi:beta-galactosidase